MIRWFRRFYYHLVPTYVTLETKAFTWREADAMLRLNEYKEAEDQWHIARAEDENRAFGIVFLERKRRLYE